MNKYAFLGLGIFYKTITFFIVEHSNHTVPYLFSFGFRLLLPDSYLYIFSLNTGLFFGIRGSRTEVSVFIYIGYHFIEVVSVPAISLSFFLSFLLILALF